MAHHRSHDETTTMMATTKKKYSIISSVCVFLESEIFFFIGNEYISYLDFLLFI